MFTLLAVAFHFYMPLEAFHTAKRKLLESQGFSVVAQASNPKRENLWTGLKPKPLHHWPLRRH